LVEEDGLWSEKYLDEWMDQTDARKLKVMRRARSDWAQAPHLMNVVSTSTIEECLGSLSDQDAKIKRSVY
jgi:hypothetical protein